MVVIRKPSGSFDTSDLTTALVQGNDNLLGSCNNACAFHVEEEIEVASDTHKASAIAPSQTLTKYAENCAKKSNYEEYANNDCMLHHWKVGYSQS